MAPARSSGVALPDSSRVLKALMNSKRCPTAAGRLSLVLAFGSTTIRSDRPGGAGEGDLYVSYRTAGAWGAPVSLGSAVNTPAYEYTPWVSADGKWLYFSRGWGEIWRISTRA